MAGPADEEKTVIEPPRPEGGVVPPIDQEPGSALPPGTRLGEFEITGLIGEGGFGIVYLAYDHSLHREVALKEYMPSSLAGRSQGITVSVRSQRHAETFNAGLRSFVNEARLLARFDHPSLVKVYRFWEANGTAYMVMPYYEGITLKQALKRSGEPPHEDWLKGLLSQLVDALETIHREQCFHRDIAPDNILLLKDGRPLLLDFGAARRVIGDMTQALTVILKPGYAPLEQYAEVPHLKQGAWTDIYALGAVVYFAITGKPPTPSVGRMMNDTLVPTTVAGAGRYSEGFLRGIDRALAVRPEDRPQTVAELRKLLGLEGYERTVPLPAAPASASEAAAPSRPAAPVPKARWGRVLGLAAVVTAVGAGGYYLLRLLPGPPPEPASPAAPAASEASAPAARPRIPEEEAAARPPMAPMPPPGEGVAATVAEPAAPVDPVAVIDGIFARRDAAHTVSVAIEKGKLRIGKDRLRVRLAASRAGYVYLLMASSDRRHLHLLFPNAADRDNRLAAGSEMSLPRPAWSMVAPGPSGVAYFVALVSDSPREFGDSGPQEAGLFAELPLARPRTVGVKPSADGSSFAGSPVCPVGAECSPAYGAAVFTVQQVDAPVERPPARSRQRPPQSAGAGGGELTEPAPERPARVEAGPAPLNLPSIPGGGRPTPGMERLLRQQQMGRPPPPAPPTEPDLPAAVPRPYIPGAGRVPGY